MTNSFMTLAEQESLLSLTVDATNQRKKSTPESDIYEYILNQLTYIQSCLSNRSEDRSKLHEVNLGRIAVRDFEGIDEEYSVLLKKVFFIVHHMRNGLKVPLLDEQGNIRK